MTKNILPLLFLVVAVVAPRPVSSQTLSMRPLWSIELRGDSIHSLANRFSPPDSGLASRPAFPLSGLIVRRPIADKSRDQPIQPMLGSIVRFNRFGRTISSTPFVPIARISAGIDQRAPAMLPIHGPSQRPSQVLTTDSIPVDTMLGWEQAPSGALGVIRDNESVLLVDPQALTVRCSHPHRAIFPAFAEDVPRVAYVAREGGPFPPDPKLEGTGKVVVLDWDCTILWEGDTFDSPPYALYFPYLSPDGNVLVYDLLEQGSESQIIVTVNLAERTQYTREEPRFSVRYYSRDGRSMLLVHADGGLAHLYDVSDYARPLRQWTYGPGFIFSSAALSDDGQYAALELRRSGQTDPRYVIVIDRQGQPIARYDAVFDTDSWGVMFRGDYLLTGVQEHPVPAYFFLEPTTRVDMFYVPDYATTSN